MKKQVYIAIAVCAAISCTVAMADWDPGMAHVMKVPQLPNGVADVMADIGAKDEFMLADDWVYSGAGPLRDAHIWTSWYGDVEGITTQVRLGIFTDVNSAVGEQVWAGTFLQDNPLFDDTLSERLYDTVPTSETAHDWINPFAPDLGPASAATNHRDIYQINIPDLTLAIEQEGSLSLTAGETYWLAAVITVASVEENTVPWLGWHTSTVTYGAGDASPMWLNPATELWEQLDGDYNLAFVMTPEPGAFALMMLTGVTLMSGRRRKRHQGA